VPNQTNDFGLSRLSGFAVMEIRVRPSYLHVQLIGLPGSDVPGVEASEFPIVSYFFSYASIHKFHASLSKDEIGEIDTEGSIKSEVLTGDDHERRYNVQMNFTNGGIVEFTCKDVHKVTTGAPEVSL
jgi:hypothetical protein